MQEKSTILKKIKHKKILCARINKCIKYSKNPRLRACFLKTCQAKICQLGPLYTSLKFETGSYFLKCVVPENIHTLPTEGNGNSEGRGIQKYAFPMG